ncbi:MAG: 16S rRNA (guanine(966)-N(2))-methyltransferase RsmD [Candidatus Omnitrophica bacterium]|nr:16S rRNA (guanine(966)-N(2))-methyltransferase RsmD [Candidatus Omnitrophota bacterium]
MRIISGKFKGRIISAPKHIRPTQDNVKKGLFDILGDMRDGVFLELFAGSGSVGIEALSLGAREAVFVEQDRLCVNKLKENLSLLGLHNEMVIPGESSRVVVSLSLKGRVFDVIFLDPPYYKDMAKKTLQMLDAYDILGARGFIVVQHFKKDIMPVNTGKLALFRQVKYGDTVLSFYKKHAPKSDLSGNF